MGMEHEEHEVRMSTLRSVLRAYFVSFVAQKHQTQQTSNFGFLLLNFAFIFPNLSGTTLEI